jgi:tRNA(Ile)-lysidine synthase
MLSQFLVYAKKRQLWREGDRILLSVSGGVDSMVMVHLFRRAKLNFAIAHCNYQLRGDASDGDQSLVEKTAEADGIPCFVRKFNTSDYASKHGISIQMAARILRLSWTEELLRAHGYASCATAHHLNDSLETVLFNLARGTGIAGLHGIQSRRGHFIRPMMFTGRSDIEAYAKQYDIAWREDASNATVKYSRNMIRHRIMPVLKEINPNLERTFADTLERLEAAEKVYEAHIAALKVHLFREQGDVVHISKKHIATLMAPAVELYELLRPFGFRLQQSQDIVSALYGTPGSIFESDSHIANIDREDLIVKRKSDRLPKTIVLEAPAEEVKVAGGHLRIRPVPADHFHPSADPYKEFFDADTIKYPLTIRKWLPGDTFHPLGMRGKKKVSDFMIDEKIALTLKTEIPVLACPKGIIWIIGHRIDDRFKVTDKTKKILNISFERDDQSL